jgi:hypothetical protein
MKRFILFSLSDTAVESQKKGFSHMHLQQEIMKSKRYFHVRVFENKDFNHVPIWRFNEIADKSRRRYLHA